METRLFTFSEWAKIFHEKEYNQIGLKPVDPPRNIGHILLKAEEDLQKRVTNGNVPAGGKLKVKGTLGDNVELLSFTFQFRHHPESGKMKLVGVAVQVEDARLLLLVSDPVKMPTVTQLYHDLLHERLNNLYQTLFRAEQVKPAHAQSRQR